jgi:hypothetical protein
MLEQRLARRRPTSSIPLEDLAVGFVALTVGGLFEGLVGDPADAERVHAMLFELVAQAAARPRDPRG